MNRDMVERLISTRRNLELRKEFAEITPGIFVIPKQHTWTKDGLMRAIKRRAWENQLRNECHIE